MAALSAGCSDSGDNSLTPPITGAPTAGTIGASGTLAPGGTGGGAGIVSMTAGRGSSGAGAGGMVSNPAGAGGAGGMTGGTSGGGSGGMMETAGSGGSAGMPPLDGPAPTLPTISEECPAFNNGSTIMAAGHRSIVIASGEPGKGGPLLFYWHGTGGSAQEVMRTIPAAVRMEIISSGGIIAAFNGSQSSGAEGDCSGTAAHNIADFKAADVIATCAVMNHGIDPRRIYTTGCSAGGLQSGCMAMLRSSYLAASAPNSGGIVGRQPWQDDHTPAIFTMHGGSSDMVIVAFSQTSMSLDSAAKMHGGFVVNCNHGGGHCQAPADLQTAAWKFMKEHPWGVSPEPWAGGIPAGVPDYCEIF